MNNMNYNKWILETANQEYNGNTNLLQFNLSVLVDELKGC